MRANYKIIGVAVGGILASSLVFQTPGQAQKVAASGNTATRDCQFLLDAYRAVIDLNTILNTGAGRLERQREFDELHDAYQKNRKKIYQEFEDSRKTLDPKDTSALMSAHMGIVARLDIAERLYDMDSNAIMRKYREANPEIKRLWDAYQDCLTKQQQAERQAREEVVSPKPSKTKTSEPPVTNAEDVIWEILMRVRTAPDPEKELKLTDEEAVALVVAMLEAAEPQAPDAKPRKPRKSVGTAGGGEQTTQAHDPGVSNAVLMMLGTAAGGIAADRLRHRDSGGGASGGGGGGGGRPVKPGSGGCAGGACPR